MKQHGLAAALLAAIIGIIPWSVAQADSRHKAGETVKVTGEIIDSWCYLTEIMYPLGTAHHQCAVWCAVGGIPVGILSDDGTPYILLSFQGNDQSVANPALLDLQTHHVVLEGMAFERDGMHYLVADRLVEDHGITNMTEEDYGIQPFGE
jgi:hypothetical protein